MGIHCEIHFDKSSNYIFVGTAGNVISGVIKYAVDEETVFNNIIVSLKGLGSTWVQPYSSRHSIDNDETYVDIDNIIDNNQKGMAVSTGTYEIPFNFVLPRNVPPSVTYDKLGSEARLTCCIKYYIRIKFNRRGVINFTKRYKKPITMVSQIYPKLPTIPTIYGDYKKLTNLLSFNSRYVNIKANIKKSILKRGDTIELDYELTNSSDLVIKGVETKLVEAHKFFFHPTKPLTTQYEDIPGTESKTSTVKCRDTQRMSVEINVPWNRESTDHCKIYSRGYYVFITAHLPVPHRNHVLKIPIQIGDVIGENVGEASSNEDGPPSYWEAMNEYEMDKIKLDELENLEKVKK